jgi:hypothetical protein
MVLYAPARLLLVEAVLYSLNVTPASFNYKKMILNMTHHCADTNDRKGVFHLHSSPVILQSSQGLVCRIMCEAQK